MFMYLGFVHTQGGMLYGHTNMGHVLCVLLWLLNGLSPSELTPNLTFLGSSLKPSSMSNASHWEPSEGCVRILPFSGSSLGLTLSACHRISFASLGSTK